MAEDLTGRRFGRWTVTHQGPSTAGRVSRWYCRCECGDTKLVDRTSLVRGDSTSCGCYFKEVNAARNAAQRGVYRKDVVTYNSAHHRVRRAKGSASTHLCEVCGSQADTWAYDHRDPDELTEIVPRRDSMIEVPYSVKPEHYTPLCHSCHAVFDYAEKAVVNA